MLPQCQAFRDMLLDAGVPQAPATGHGSVCAACASWAHSTERLARQLQTLPRAAAPAELEGRVVAALQAGHRQNRAVQAVADLGRISSPAVLDEFVDADLEEGLASPARPPSLLELQGRRIQAPSVLDRLVREEIAEPSRSLARRYLGSLRRKRAPEELRLRVAVSIQRVLSAQRALSIRTALSTGVRGLRRGAGGQPQRPIGLDAGLKVGARRAVGAGLAVAALLFVLGVFLLRPTPPLRPHGPQIVVEQVADPSGLPPFAAALLDGASGGLLSVERL